MKPTTFALAILAGSGLVASPAAAGVRIDVDPGAPFTERDLADAVELRDTNAADPGAGEVVVHVAKLGMDQLIVTVDGRVQVVALPDRDRATTTRVVALVVTSMLTRDAAEVPPVPDAVGAELDDHPARPAPRTFLHVGTTLTRDDNGYVIPFVHGGAAYSLAPGARVTGTIGLGQYDGYLDTRSTLVPIRVGVEGRSGAAGVELGGQLLAFRETSCGTAQWGSVRSVYGAGKVFLPVGQHARVVGELGGHFAMGTSGTGCNSASNYTSYGGWMGLGLEWAR